MKPTTLLLTILVCAIKATGQNFIPNPDFSLYDDCPTSYSNTDNCMGWYQPTGGTSDYFNVCADAYSEVKVPVNFAGVQTANSNAYLGLFCYESGKSVSGYREYIGTSFAPLTQGKKYDITVYASLADSSNAACDGLGIYFTTYKYQSNSYTRIPATPQIDFSSYGPVTDKNNWVQLTGSFIADSAYTNLTIGNFKENSDLNILYNDQPTSQQWDTAAYYYIGMIQVADSTGIIPINTDTVKYTFPSAFTPNGDGNNDVFRIIGNHKEEYNNYLLNVYNRFGECVFYTKDVNDGWDGIYRNIPQEVGVYFYMASFVRKGEQHLLKGDVTLIR